MANHKRYPTMKDVAEEAGVAVSTVSHVVNRSAYVTEATAAKVEEAIRRLGFRTNLVARNLRSGKSHVIGFIVSNLSSYFYIRIARGIEQAVRPHGYNVVLVESQETIDTEVENIESLFDRNVDGVILVPTCPSCDHLRKVADSGYPVVLVDRQPEGVEFDTILLANEDAGYRATRHLIQQGHTEIAFVGFHFGHGEIDTTMRERMDGYRRAHEEAGLSVRPECLQVAAGGAALVNQLRYAESYRMTERLLDSSSITAILCGNNLASIGVFSCLKDRNVRIPEAVALITFDDELWLSLSTPRISAVAQPAELMGAAAAEHLLKRIDGRTESPECIRLKAELIVRESS